MAATMEQSMINRKTQELCQAILDEPSVQTLRKSIDSFMANESARAQYDGVVAKGQALQQKQQMAVALTDAEISDFERDRDALLKNPIASDFLDAQHQLRSVQESIHRHVNKTFELGRLPSEEDLSSSCCSDGQGCGCSH